MFSFNEHHRTKYQNSQQHRVPAVTCDNRPGQPPGLESFIDRLKLKPGGAFNVKLKQQSRQLCAKLGQLQYGRLKDDLQRSLGKFAPTQSRRKPPPPTPSANTSRPENRARSSCVAVFSSTAIGAGQRQPVAPLLQRSFSVNPRSSLAGTTFAAAEQHRAAPALRRNEWNTRSLHQKAAKNLVMRQRARDDGGGESAARKRPVALHAAKQRQRAPLAARLMKWPLLARDQQLEKKSEPKRVLKQEQPTIGCTEKSRSQSIVSLLSAAAASRRQNRRTSPGGGRVASGVPFMLVAALQLLLVLVSILAPLQPVAVDCAPISQFVSIQPVWLADGLMDVSESSSLDGDNAQPSADGPLDIEDAHAPSASDEDEASLARALLDRMATTREQQQNELDANEQQVGDRMALGYPAPWQPPKRSWLSLASKQEQRAQPPGPARMMGLPYLKRRAHTASDEYLWIERRRLNRDRALEQPAWLRTRPIRRGFGGGGGGDDDDDDDDDGAQAAQEQAASEQQQMSESTTRPIRRRSSRGRQLRESTGETYDQILRHLLEEALENGSLLAELYDNLEARTRGGQPGRTPGLMTQLDQPLTAQQAATLADKSDSARQSEEGQEGSLVVAGDEVSSEDDATPVDPPVVLPAPAPLSSAVTRGPQPNSFVLAPARPQVDQLAPLATTSGNPPLLLSPAELTSIDAGAISSGGLIELMRQATGPVDQQEPSFHVIEDIDQADSSQETNQQDQQQQSDDQLAGSGPAGSAPTVSKRSIELDSSIVGDFKEADEQAEGTPQSHDQLPAPQQVVVARRASFGRGADQQPDGRARPQKDSQQQPVAVDRSLAATAIRLIRSGYFTRAQLVQFATKLRVFLENRLGLARSAITGLFPVDTRRLLVELNPERLTQSDRQMLTRVFGFSRDSNSLALTWPDGSASSQLPADNPLPILSAILGALYDDETTGAAADERMPVEEARGDAQPTMGVQINELPPVASALVARDLSQQQQPRDRIKAEEVDQDQEQESAEQGANGRAEGGEQIQGGLLMSPVEARRYVQPRAPQLSEAPAPPFAMDQQLGWARPLPQSWDDYYESRRRVAMLASYLGALYGLSPQPQQQQQQLVLPAEFALWEHELATGGAPPQLGLALGGVAGAGPPNATSGEVGVVSTPAIYRRLLAVLGVGSPLARVSPQSNGEQREQPPSALWGHHLLAIVLALAVTFVIVKLILKRLDTTRHAGKRRRLSTMTGSSSASTFCERARLWSSPVGKWWPVGGGRAESDDCESGAGSPAQLKGETLASGGKPHPLGEAAFAHTQKQRPSADSGLETIDGTEGGGVGAAANSSEKIRRSFEHLTRRLTRLLSVMRSDERQLQKCENAELAAALEGAGLEVPSGVAGGAPPESPQQQFRSSTSYIRSLIEALTKAASAQMAGTGQASALNDDDDDDDDEEEEDEDCDKLVSLESGLAANKQRQAEQVFQPDDDPEILMAQMDISAAHLILDYMEKHLVDKERLRREWLELNGGTTPPPTNGGRGAAQQLGPSTSVTTSKANQLVLQRLAKIALNEDNYHKNRNPNVVPFDRNRVRLGANGGEPPSGPAPAASKQKLRNQRNARNGSKNSAGLDYINASFIYDDDPRRPTHIVAQGPKEQTCGQFWQMVWEQEISVIVMLTRLNENSAQMCHCYWPTQIGAAQVCETGADAAAGKPELSPPPPPVGNPNGARRGSVTSVFSGLAGPKHPNSSAIVAGALNETALYFELALSPSANTSRSGSRQTSRSSAEDDPEQPGAPTSSTSADKKSRGGVAGKTLALEVRLISEHVSSSDYLVRNMYLIDRATGETRTISQFHYLAWQEGRTPESVRSFLQFRRKVHKSYRNLASPILVHCSDGAGRSGTYALIDIILERIRNGAKEIDLRATLEHLRDQRIGLCENQAQFEFVLVALAEEIQIILNALPQ